MAAIRYAIAVSAGVTGFLGGVLYENKKSSKFRVNAGKDSTKPPFPPEILMTSERRAHKNKLLSVKSPIVIREENGKRIVYDNRLKLPISITQTWRFSSDYVDDTDGLNNSAPQVDDFNKGMSSRINEHVNNKCRERKYESMTKTCGPIFFPSEGQHGKRFVIIDFDENDAAVPEQTYSYLSYKRGNIVCEEESFILPSEPVDEKIPITKYTIPDKELIEKHIGVKFGEVPSTTLHSINAKESRPFDEVTSTSYAINVKERRLQDQEISRSP